MSTTTTIRAGRRSAEIVLLLFLTLGWGCAARFESPSEAAQRSVPGPRGTFALALPDGLGYVELLVERIGGSGKSLGTTMVLAAYFVDPDGKSPMVALPASVEAALRPQGAEPSQVNLVPRSLGNDAWSHARFASEPGDFSQDEIHGELKIQAAGKTVSVPIALR